MSKKTTPAAPAAPLATSIAELSTLDVKSQCKLFAEKSNVARTSFAEMGKLIFLLRQQKGFKPYVDLAKYGVRATDISNAKYGADAFALVDEKHITEPEFDSLRYTDCVKIAQTMGGKSKRKLSGPEIADLLRDAPDSFAEELESIFDTGLNIAEVKAEATTAKAKAEADKKAADDKRIQDEAAKLAAKLAAQQQQAPPAAPVVTAGTTTVTPTAAAHPLPNRDSVLPTASAPPTGTVTSGPDNGEVGKNWTAITPAEFEKKYLGTTDAKPEPDNILPGPTAKCTLTETMDMIDTIETGLPDLSDDDAETVFLRIAEIQSSLADRLSKPTLAKAA